MSRISDLAGFTTALSTTQDLSVGVITATSFSGDGSGLTGVASTDNIQTATDAKFLANVNITGITTATGGFVGALTGNATGLSGTPNITVGSVSAASGSFSGNVTIGGTLTYQDVTNVDAIGIVTARAGVKVPDNQKVFLGTGDDLEIFHDGTHSRIKDVRDSGTLRLQADGFKVIDKDAGETMISAVVDGAVELYHNNSKKLETSSGGVTVTGTVAATSYTGDGSALTGISVGITTESITATDQSIATLNLSKDAHKVKVSGAATIDCQGGSEYETHILTIENTGIATVGFSTYFLFPSGAEPSLPTASGAISQLSFTVHRVGAAGTQVLTTAAVNFS